MQTIEERAKSYAEAAHAQFPELCAFDYIAGAKEEHILLTEWHEAEEKSPDVGVRVLCKQANGTIAVGMRMANNLYRIDNQGVLAPTHCVKWREIHE